MMPNQPEMSPATKELLKKVRMMVPPMLEKFHKGPFPFPPQIDRCSLLIAPCVGMLGRVAVIGGSEKYVDCQ